MKKINGATEKAMISSNQESTVLFWLCAGFLALLLASTASRDITRPFYGLHSWGEAHYAWVARSHVKYGLGYTKGFDTFAVGNPPTNNPSRYLDHPQTLTLIHAAAMLVFGVNTWSIRLVNIAATVISLLIFIRIVKGLTDEKTSLLSGLMFAIFPIFGYFAVYGMLFFPFCMLAFYSYLVIIKALKDGPEPTGVHLWTLAISLFLAIQLGWEGFFYALAVGAHYVFRCVRRKRLASKTLLAVLIIAPLSSLVLVFVVLAAGHNWDFQRILEVAKWRATTGEIPNLTWGKWLGRFWEHAIDNFSLAVLIAVIAYLTAGQLYIFSSKNSKTQTKTAYSRLFPQFWLFTIPPISQLVLLKGALWPHQYWERPMVPFIAIAAALAILTICDLLIKINKKLAIICSTALTLVFFVSCVIGTNYYYNIRWQCAEKLNMFTMLNKRIPPDKYLLSYEDFIVDQHKAKASSYRPEFAWYLDREIHTARSIEEVQQKAATGKYPYYLIPNVQELAPLTSQLIKRYKYEYIPEKEGETTKDGKFLKVSMFSYLIFDLKSK